jgi:hypothetical protein
MKAMSALLVTALLALLPLSATSADTDKVVQNTKGPGKVTYGGATANTAGTDFAFTGKTSKLAPKASTPLSDLDGVATDADSQATVTLPDSSQILLGSNSKAQMTSFNLSDIAHAKFVVIGKMRFTVNHPNGAKADYTFATPTGQIAVRGTVGDIFAQPGGGLQVNVYALSDPTLPVQVTLVNGQVFTLAAGQSLVVTATAGAVTASVTSVSQSMFTPFSELGAPANAGELGITATTAGAGAAGAGAGAATGAIAAGAAGAAAAATAISNSNGSSPAPLQTSTPSPQPSTTSVPITVSKQTPAPKTPAPPPPPGAPSGPSGPHFPGVRPTPGAR